MKDVVISFDIKLIDEKHLNRFMDYRWKQVEMFIKKKTKNENIVNKMNSFE